MSADGAPVLILGGLAGQNDAVRSLQASGRAVHACAHDRDGPVAGQVAAFHLIDITDVDAVTALVSRIGARWIASVGSDIALPTIAAVSERLGLPHLVDAKTTALLRDKAALRGFLDQHRLGEVAYRRVSRPADIDASFPYPAVLKPVDSQGQRGIAVVETMDEAIVALPAALATSWSGSAIVEEYLDGPEVSVHVFLVDGRIAFSEASDRHHWPGPMPGVALAHTMPSRWVGQLGMAAELEALVVAFVDAIGLRDGPLYLQLKLTSRGPRIIEVAPRFDGCHLWRLIDVLYGVDLLQAYWALLDGQPVPVLERLRAAGSGELRFHLVAPGAPVDVGSFAPPEEGEVVFEELHLDEHGRARATNAVVARAGYRITVSR